MSILFQDQFFRFRKVGSAKCSCFDTLRYLRAGLARAVGPVRPEVSKDEPKPKDSFLKWSSWVDQSERRRPEKLQGRRIAGLCIWGIWLLAAVGCAAGPDYHRPETRVADQWSNLSSSTTAEPSITTARQAELVEWWRSFDDPTLTDLVERAIKANLDVHLAEARLRQARASRGVVAAGLWPQIDSSATYRTSRSGGSSQGGSGTNAAPGGSGSSSGAFGGNTRDLFQVGLDAAWELDIFGGVRRNIEASEADIQAAVEDRRDVLVSLVAELGTDYLNLRGFQQQIAIANRNLDAQVHTAEITRKRYDAGFVSALDVANANAQVATTKAQIPLLESSAQATIYSLSLLLGLQPAALASELSTTMPIPPTPPEVPVGLPSELLRRRPDIRRAEAQIHAATARIGVATADLFPKFSLTGSLGLNSSQISDLANWSSRFWTFGPTVSWPVFDAGRIRWNIEVQNALQEQSLVSYEKTVLTALKDVETALVAYAKEQEHRSILSDQLEYNRKAADLSMKLYIAGRTDFLNVLVTQRALYNTEDALVQSTRTLSTNLIALYKALGGGWENQS
jgi:multidrug efflux system outer membrane protein